jgi:uncharacterized protein YoxC
MTWLLVSLTVLEVAVALAVLAIYLTLITRRLRYVSEYLGKIAFGVRAVDTQTSSIGDSVIRINKELRAIRHALGPLAEKAKGS